MTDRRRFEQISPSALRDHGGDERIDRVWQRLRDDMPPTRRRRVVGAQWWLAPAGVAVFGAGVLVGASGFGSEPQPVATMMAEPALVPEPAAAPREPDPVVTPPVRANEPRRRRLRGPRSTAPAPAVPSTEPAVELPEPVVVSPAPAGPPGWQLLADEGLYDQALGEIDQSGGFEGVMQEATAEQLMALVDVARGTRQRDQAIRALRQVVNQHGSDPNAPIAAWMLGNELVKAGDPDGAAQAFAMYRALSPQGDFAEDALGRQFEVAADQGNLDHARRLAEQYARDFPDGPRGEFIRGRLKELSKQVEAERAVQPPPFEPVESVAAESPAEHKPAAPPAGPGDSGAGR